MVFVNVLGDGVTIPTLRSSDLLVTLNYGNIEVGIFNKKIFCNEKSNYLDTPKNIQELREALNFFVQNTLPDLLSKKHIIYFLCPKEIAVKAIWE